MTKQSLPIIILAAGASSRMRGRDKLMEKVNGLPLLRLQADRALAAGVGPVVIALPAPPHPRYGALEDLSVQIVPVPDAATGMSASLKTAFAALPAEAPAAMLVLADLPDITAQDLETVAKAVDLETDTVVWRGATQDGAPGHPIMFHASLFSSFSALTGDSGGREVLAKAKGRIKLIALPEDRARRDLDTPEDWAAWRAARH